MDEVAHKLLAMMFPHAEENVSALRAMTERIAAAARKPDGETVTYAELVANLLFREGTREFRITPRDFAAHNRRFVSWMLGHLSKQTYLQGSFFAGAMVVDKKTRRPAASFFEFAREVGALATKGHESEERFWKSQRARAHEFYRKVDPREPGLPAQLPEFLARGDDGYVRVAGHRVGLPHIIHYYRQGYSAEMLKEQFPTLPLAVLHKVIGFYLEGPGWVDHLVSVEEQRVAHQREAAPAPPPLDELRRRYLATRKSRAG